MAHPHEKISSGLNKHLLRQVIEKALIEDLGMKGDVTTSTLIPEEMKGRTLLLVREEGIVAGLGVAKEVFLLHEPTLLFHERVQEGSWVEEGTALAEIEGSVGKVLEAERTALNFLCHLSGIATFVHKALKKIDDVPTCLLDTRKTTPNLRFLEKYAVRVGGGKNHRMGLFDMALIKDNHIKALAKSQRIGEQEAIRRAIKRARELMPATMKIEVEAGSLEEARAGMEAGADMVMLDNMSLEAMREVVALKAQGGWDAKVLLEASGSISLETIRDTALTGVDFISMGSLTHSAPALNISLEMGEVQ